MDSKLAAIIVHDLKNALGILEGELLGLTTSLDQEQAVQAHTLCVSLREKLIGFLTLYKASSQGLTARIDAFSPEDFIRALANNCVTNRTDLTVRMNTNNMPVIGFFDENLVALALESALQNATRFACSTIEIGCIDNHNYLSFYVRDDGPGLGTEEATPSTGLGMELCKVIAQAHNKEDKVGLAQVNNHSSGGALFELRLPK